MKNQCILFISQFGNAPVLVKNDIIKFTIELCKFNFLRACIVSSQGRQSKAFLKSTLKGILEINEGILEIIGRIYILFLVVSS